MYDALENKSNTKIVIKDKQIKEELSDSDYKDAKKENRHLCHSSN